MSRDKFVEFPQQPENENDCNALSAMQSGRDFAFLQCEIAFSPCRWCHSTALHLNSTSNLWRLGMAKKTITSKNDCKRIECSWSLLGEVSAFLSAGI